MISSLRHYLKSLEATEYDGNIHKGTLLPDECGTPFANGY
jgi:hypothetical protein